MRKVFFFSLTALLLIAFAVNSRTTLSSSKKMSDTLNWTTTSNYSDVYVLTNSPRKANLTVTASALIAKNATKTEEDWFAVNFTETFIDDMAQIPVPPPISVASSNSDVQTKSAVSRTERDTGDTVITPAQNFMAEEFGLTTCHPIRKSCKETMA